MRAIVLLNRPAAMLMGAVVSRKAMRGTLIGTTLCVMATVMSSTGRAISWTGQIICWREQGFSLNRMVVWPEDRGCEPKDCGPLLQGCGPELHDGGSSLQDSRRRARGHAFPLRDCIPPLHEWSSERQSCGHERDWDADEPCHRVALGETCSHERKTRAYLGKTCTQERKTSAYLEKTCTHEGKTRAHPGKTCS